jgi:hypothetical protein
VSASTSESVHVCLVDPQETLPNLIPLLMDPPRTVLLVITPRVKQLGIAERIRGLARSHGIEVQEFDGAPATDWEALRENAIELCTFMHQQFGGRRVVLNISGGTKLMAFAYGETLRELLDPDHLEIIYCDALESEVDILLPPNRPSVPLRNVLDVSGYLLAQGMRLEDSLDQDPEWIKAVERRLSATRMLLDMALSDADFIGALNYMSSRALSRDGRQLSKPEQHLREVPKGEWRAAIETLKRHDLLAWAEGETAVQLPSVRAARFLAGGWLEEFAWHTARELNPHEVRAGVVGSWESDGELQPPSNEFDLLVVHRNRLLVVECKTAFMRRGKDAQRILYKLESLASALGGKMGSALLLSARPLSSNQLGRARQQRIDCLSGSEVKGLRDYIAQWMVDGSVPSVDGWRDSSKSCRDDC